MAAESTRTMRLDIGYRGAEFFGSQRQPGFRTVQGELESALEQIGAYCEPIVLAGRTDRGVHAVGQVASGRVTWNGDLERLRYALDSLTGADLAVYRVREAPEVFHARFSAMSREYRYRIWNSLRRPILLAGAVGWVRDTLDFERMDASTRALAGEHDFRSFAGKGVGSGKDDANTVRAVYEVGWCEIDNVIEPGGRLIEFRIRASGFLPHMVRNIVGSQIEIGIGKHPVELVWDLMGRRDRAGAPPPAPSEGLVLWRVNYENEHGAGHDRQPIGQDRE